MRVGRLDQDKTMVVRLVRARIVPVAHAPMAARIGLEVRVLMAIVHVALVLTALRIVLVVPAPLAARIVPVARDRRAIRIARVGLARMVARIVLVGRVRMVELIVLVAAAPLVASGEIRVPIQV